MPTANLLDNNTEDNFYMESLYRLLKNNKLRLYYPNRPPPYLLCFFHLLVYSLDSLKRFNRVARQLAPEA